MQDDIGLDSRSCRSHHCVLLTMNTKKFTTNNRACDERKQGMCAGLVLLCSALASAALAQDASRFEKEVLVAGCSDPLQMDIAADGRVFFIERKGAVKLWEPLSRPCRPHPTQRMDRV